MEFRSIFTNGVRVDADDFASGDYVLIDRVIYKVVWQDVQWEDEHYQSSTSRQLLFQEYGRS